MKRLLLPACACISLFAHDVITTKVTWDREIVRIVFANCASCHHDGGSAFSLMTYQQARPWAKAIKEEVLERRMPPFGAVKGFGDLRDDKALSQEQIERITDWVEGGAPEGDPALLPPNPDFKPAAPEQRAASEFLVDGGAGILPHAMTFAAIRPKTLGAGASVRVVARTPDRGIVPLLWIYQYNPAFARTFFFRHAMTFPGGTRIIASPKQSGSVALISGTADSVTRKPMPDRKPSPTPAAGAASVASPAPARPDAAANVAPQIPLDYVCPMDPDIRSDQPGKCPRCGMTLKLGIPDQSEYPLELTSAPSPIRPREKTQLRFTIRDPKDGSVVRDFEIVHEKLFHLFIVSSDLKYFLHAHPMLQPDGAFVLDQVFPKPGMYRVLSDVYPRAGTPQLLPKTLFVSSGPNDAPPLAEVRLEPDMAVQHGENTDVELAMDPPKPIAGLKTHVWFKFRTSEGLEKYLGAWAHMLIASDDTLDLMHEHPFIADGGPQMQFDIIFPRARTYRVWLQFQRKGVVNTIAVNIPVLTLEQAEGVTASTQ